jgi:PadR family transcriptional regulator PadR
MLEACVLGVLRAAPAYGYEITCRFEAAGLPRPKGGTLYPMLSRLEGDGLIEATWAEGDKGPSRKYYALTGRGQTAAITAAATWPRFVASVSALIGQPEGHAT